jgi:hypothetical protein
LLLLVAAKHVSALIGGRLIEHALS